MDRASPELIEEQMQQTRASLTEKVSALENQVIGTIHNATHAVNTAVESVKGAVHDVSATVKSTVADSVHTVREQVSTTLDLPRQTRERPWAMVGGAAAVGFVAGYFIFGSRGEHSRAARSAIDGSFEGLAAASRRPPSPVAPEPPRQPGLLDELLSRVGDEARKLGEMALATATASLRETVQKQVPRLIEDGIPKLIEEGLPRFVGNGRSAERSYSPPDGFTREPYSRATNGPEARSAM